MGSRIINIYYGEDCLPYKDSERTVHYPIVGAAIQGASSTTKIRFYFDELISEDDETTSWVVVSKLPNGKIGSEIVETELDSELNEHYALFSLKNFYTQAKGDLFLSLQGYQGGVQVETDPDTGISQIVGTPTIQATGSIKLAINYATQLVGSGETANINFQKILADLGTKLGIRAYTERVTELPTIGQTNVFYAIYDDPNNPNKLNIYVWNGTTKSYVWVGDNSLYLGEYYTSEQAETFEQSINDTLDGFENRINDVENELESVASGAPSGAYANLAAVAAAFPTGNSNIYITLDNGHWCYWNGSAWTDGGVYLSTGDAVPETRKIAGISLENNISKSQLQSALDISNVFELILPDNLFNPASNDMRVLRAWYYTNTLNDTLTLTTEDDNPSVAPYSALKIPVYDGINAVTFSNTTKTFFGIYAVDSDMKVLKIADNSSQTALNNYVFTLPSDTKYVCLSILTNTQGDLNLIMCNSGSTAKPWSAYFTPYFKIKDTVYLGVETKDIEDGAVTIPKTDFIKMKEPDNLFDASSNEMAVKEAWYYSNTLGATLEIETKAQQPGAAPYVAIKIPIYSAEAVTFSLKDFTTITFYGIYAVDADMKVLKIADNSSQTALNNYVFTLPSGTVYVCLSLLVDYSNIDEKLNSVMCASGTTPQEYKPYQAPFYYIENFDIYNEQNQEFKENTISIIGSEPNDIEVKLPTSYELVVGDTFELFYKGIVQCDKIELLGIEVVCYVGKGFTDRFIYEPQNSEIGNHTLTIRVYGINHNLLSSGTTTLIVKAKATSPANNVNVLCVGDSLTNGGQWVGEFRRRLISTGGSPTGDNLSNITFVGTKQLQNGTRYEGYGGWTFNSYNTANVSNNVKVLTVSSHDKNEGEDQHSIYQDANGGQWKLETIETTSIKIIAINTDGNNFPSTGTLTWVSGGVNHNNIVYTASTNGPGNPFWNADEEKVDFEWYAEQLGITSIDYVYVLLGWNSQTTPVDTYKQQCQTFIDNVHDAFPNAKIVLMGLEIPARDGLANNYGSTESDYANYYKSMKFVFDIESWYNEIASNNTNVSVINISGQFDTVHNMPQSTRQVNVRNPETQVYQTNGVHPSTYGYYQIADATYRDFMHKIQE